MCQSRSYPSQTKLLEANLGIPPFQHGAVEQVFLGAGEVVSGCHGVPYQLVPPAELQLSIHAQVSETICASRAVDGRAFIYGCFVAD